MSKGLHLSLLALDLGAARDMEQNFKGRVCDYGSRNNLSRVTRPTLVRVQWNASKTGCGLPNKVYLTFMRFARACM